MALQQLRLNVGSACFLRHGLWRMADLGLELAVLKVIQHWNEKNQTSWWEEVTKAVIFDGLVVLHHALAWREVSNIDASF